MASIYINGKCYHVTHNKLAKDHDFSKAFYDYRENNNTYTKWTIEFTMNQAVFNSFGATNFNFDWLDVLEYDNIEDAIKMFTKLRYNNSVLWLHMFMDVYHNNELILTECKTDTMYAITDQPTLKRLENAEKSAQIYKEKYERLQKFVDMYNINDLEIDRRLQENNK